MLQGFAFQLWIITHICICTPEHSGGSARTLLPPPLSRKRPGADAAHEPPVAPPRPTNENAKPMSHGDAGAGPVDASSSPGGICTVALIGLGGAEHPGGVRKQLKSVEVAPLWTQAVRCEQVRQARVHGSGPNSLQEVPGISPGIRRPPRFTFCFVSEPLNKIKWLV